MGGPSTLVANLLEWGRPSRWVANFWNGGLADWLKNFVMGGIADWLPIFWNGGPSRLVSHFLELEGGRGTVDSSVGEYNLDKKYI